MMLRNPINPPFNKDSTFIDAMTAIWYKFDRIEARIERLERLNIDDGQNLRWYEEEVVVANVTSGPAIIDVTATNRPA